MLSLLCSFSSLFLKALFSRFCCLQQLALEPKSVASHSSSLSFSLLSLITKVLWKCKPLLGSEVFFDEVFFLAGVSSVWRLVHGVGCIDWVCLVAVSSVWWVGVVGRFDWAHVFILAGVSTAFWAGVVASADGWWSAWVDVEEGCNAWWDGEVRCVEGLFARWSGSGLKEVFKGETIVSSESVEDHLFVAWAFLASSRNFCLVCSSSFFCFFSCFSFSFCCISLSLSVWSFVFFFFFCWSAKSLGFFLFFWTFGSCMVFVVFSLFFLAFSSCSLSLMSAFLSAVKRFWK